jgi:outer membrane protein TolC
MKVPNLNISLPATCPDFLRSLARRRFGAWGVGAILVWAAVLPASKVCAQELPSAPDKPWFTPTEKKLANRAASMPMAVDADPEAGKVYTLADLIDFAEARSPETREAWQAAVAQAKAKNIARSALFPTLDVTLLAASQRNGVLLYDSFVIQQLGLGQASARMTYTVFDANGRLDRLAQQRELLHASAFRFNDAHRKLMYSVMHAYYALLDAKGQREAAEANLTSAKAVADSTQERFDHGLATLPDLSEAKAAAAQANYELQLRIGAEQKADGVLSTMLTAPADRSFSVQSIGDLAIPSTMPESAHELIEQALRERPDLLAQASGIEATKDEVREARSRYSPEIKFNGTFGELRGIGTQTEEPTAYATGRVWDAEMQLTWNVFDAGERRNRVAEAQANVKREREALRGMRDEVESEVWQAYIDAQTALHQRDAATALLNASQDSYQQALESYQYGVRNIVDVLTAQRQLAQARFEDTAARVAVLDAFAQLSFRTGALLRTRGVQQP